MKIRPILIVLFLCLNLTVYGQFEYEASLEYPFGRPNPNAPEQIKDYDELIGNCNCKSIKRNTDGTWKEAVAMKWQFKYILNGLAVQDRSLSEDQTHAGSIRQYNADSSRWYVHWYASKTPSVSLPVWEGNRKDGKIQLYRKQNAPNGAEGYYRLTFFEIRKSGFKWIGEWVDLTEKIVYPTWKIECIKEEDN